MPTYDYRCSVNDTVVEVRHPMSYRVATWGELCEMAGIDPGNTDGFAPVERLANGGNVVRSHALKNAKLPECNPETCCGACAFQD